MKIILKKVDTINPPLLIRTKVKLVKLLRQRIDLGLSHTTEGPRSLIFEQGLAMLKWKTLFEQTVSIYNRR